MAPGRRPTPPQGQKNSPSSWTTPKATCSPISPIWTFPTAHRAKLHSTNPIERVNGEIKRRADVIGIFPNDEAVIRLVGAILLEQNDGWAVQRGRYMTLESVATVSDNPVVLLSAVPA
jgi:putative transposase